MHGAGWLHATRRVLARIPLTGRGLVVAVAAGLATRSLGYGSLDLVALTLGVAGLGLIVAAGLLTAGFALWLRRSLRSQPPGTPPARCEADSPFETGFALRAPGWLPLVSLDWSWVEPPAASCRTLVRDGVTHERVTLRARCETSRVTRRLAVRDVFGLWRFRWERSEAAAFINLPSLRALRRIGVIHSLSSGEDLPHPAGEFVGDRLEIRRYAPGDPVRHILWKAYARTRDLYVRTPERSLADAKRSLAYLVTDADDEAAAAALRVTVQSGALGDDWVVGADGVDETADELTGALALIARSGNPDAREQAPAAGLEAFLRGAARGATRCVVFVPATSHAWLDTALGAVTAWPGTRFVLAADGVARREAASFWQRALFAEPAVPGVDAADLSRTVARITAAGHTAVFVDRATGQVAGTERLMPTRLSA
jgi:hypothetical protein